MSKKISKFILSKKMAVCTFPNDTKITTMAPLRSENILITCKNNVCKTNRQSLFHKFFFLIGPFILEIEEFMCFFIIWKIFMSDFFYPYMKWRSVKHTKILTFIEWSKDFCASLSFWARLHNLWKLPRHWALYLKKEGTHKNLCFNES